MQLVGKINIEIYRCITADITTDEVIITDERVQHIRERHPGDYEKIKEFLKEALEAPDYILEDKSPNSGLILKMVEWNGLRFQVVLRVHTSTDNPEFKNTIISAWEISESRWRNYLNNQKVKDKLQKVKKIFLKGF